MFVNPALVIVPPKRFRPVDVESSDFKDIKESIKEIGQLQPVLASKTPVLCDTLEPGEYELIAGLHRLIACKSLGREVWIETDESGNLSLDNADLRKIAELHENVKRKDFTIQQKSIGISELHQIMQKKYGIPATGGKGQREGWRMEDTAKKLGFKSEKTVRSALQIAGALGKVEGVEKAATEQEALKIVRDNVKRTAVQEMVRRRAASNTDKEMGDPHKYFGQRVIEGSCLQMKQQPTGICNIFVTDPPWKIDIDKKEEREGSAVQKSLEEYDDSSDEILPLLAETIKEMARVGKPDCWVVMFCGARHWTWLFDQFKQNGFQVYSKPLVWTRVQKDGTVFRGKSGAPSMWPASATDFILLARRGNAVLAKLNQADAFLYPIIPGNEKIHRAQKPIPLLIDIISRFYHEGTNPLLIDPFAGSGSTLVAARRVGIRNYFGYELDPANRERAISYMVQEYLEDQKPAKVVGEVDLSDFPD